MAGTGLRMHALFLLLGLSQICTADHHHHVSVYTVTSYSVTMQWPAYPGASHYRVQATPQLNPGHSTAFSTFNGNMAVGGLNTLSANTVYTMQVDAMDDELNVLSTIGTKEALTAPEVPEITLAYSKQSSSITVEFNNVTGATGYILRAMSDVDDFFEETAVNESPGTIQGLDPFTDYTLSVMSVNAGGRSQPSYNYELRTVVTAPQLTTISETNSTINASWPPVEHAAFYSLYIFQTPSTNNLTTYITNQTSFTFDGLSPGTYYCIKATASDQDGRAGDHNRTCQITRPPTPKPVEVLLAIGQIRVPAVRVYFGSSKGADTYFVESSTGQNCTPHQSLSLNYCIISPLVCGQNLSVMVTAANTAGPSVPSAEEDFQTYPCPPERIWVEEPWPASCRVAFSLSPMADFYMVFVKRDDGIEMNCNTTGAPCPFTCTCGFTYFSTVFAHNPSGSSPWGAVANYTTIPCCPENVTVQLVSTETLEIEWVPVRGADLYETRAEQTEGVIHCNDTSPVCALSDLSCNTWYSVVVTPCSELRGCNVSCQPQQHETAPCTPQIHNLTQASESSITVHYTTPNGPSTNYSVSAVGRMDTHHCHSQSASCELTQLPCGAVFEVVAVASNAVGPSLPSFSVPLETGPCCPSNLSVMQVTQAMSNVTWGPSLGARSYMTALTAPRGHAQCHTMSTHCLMGCLTCGTNYSVNMEAISSTGHVSNCSYSGFSASACCPTHVKLHRMSNHSMRVSWRSSAPPHQNYTVAVSGAGSNHTCTQAPSRRYCDVQNVTVYTCGDVYTVAVAPVNSDGSVVSFCPQRIYAVSCSGNSVGMAIYRGRVSTG
ncbi:fibronectin type III domain-containing protein 7 [Gadus morhua]|uniref:fibronectin type III domain-containing protein 7 n=1 Tax=Gadus morhua TaxID=8049 RepID=UPI0011B6C3B8|nr:fibronectin type III domain-containing protein 7-like [Gadus morhua]